MDKEEIIEKLIAAFNREATVFICGNGGSAAMAQHFVGEFLGKFLKDRRPLPALSLTSETAAITAIANDYGYEYIFSRQLEALAKKNDVLIVLSTSGESRNCLMAIRRAKEIGMVVIDFPRKGNSTPEIQENQFKLMHDVCREVEERMFP